jgi:hypothetical protein
MLRALAPGWEIERRIRLLRWVLAALALVFVMVGVSSTAAVDVAYSVMEGATRLTHGVLPYGHMPGDVIHGDTYPLLSYVLYTPLAWIAPVRSVWDSVDVALGAAVVAALACASMLARARARLSVRRRSAEAQIEGLRAAIAWLAFPPLLIVASSGTTDVALGAMVLGAVILWRRPGASTGVLCAAAWFKAAPVALLPTWLAAQGRRGLVRAILAILVVSLPLLALLVAVGGASGPAQMVHAMSFQLARSSPQSFWSSLGIDSLQPVGEACLLGLLAGVAVRVRHDPWLAADRARLAALAAAILIALQLAASYWAFLYVSWVVPLLCLSMFAESP